MSRRATGSCRRREISQGQSVGVGAEIHWGKWH